MSALVLVVEDNAINAELLAYLLGALGYRAVVAVDGRSGLEAARRESPDLILCDIQMPDLDGYAFARIAKADLRLREIPLVAVTASAMVGDRDRILAAGFDGYIAKPIDPETFAQRMARLLDGAPPKAPAPAPGDAPPAEPSAAAGSGARRHRVLVLDDTDLNLQLKRDLLEPHGYEVLTAATADEAIALALAHRPDLIVSDVGMRGGSGLSFLERVKAQPPLADIPFVFLTATHWDPDAEREAYARGADGYLRRPMEPDALLAALAAHLARGPVQPRTRRMPAK